MRNRRTVIQRIGALGAIGALAGCSGEGTTMTDADGNGGAAVEAVGATIPMRRRKPKLKRLTGYRSTVTRKSTWGCHRASPAEPLRPVRASARLPGVHAGIGLRRPGGAERGHDRREQLQRYGFGSWEYRGIIAVRNDSDIERLSDLSGKTVAFSDRLSTSDALYPLYSMPTEGDLDIGDLPEGNGAQAEFEPRFAGGHVQS